MPSVAVILGSDSDLPALQPAFATLDELGIEFEAHICSAHRTPDEAAALAAGARGRGVGVIIAAAGKAAHLAGALAARTTLPVIGVPLTSSELDGLDALLSTVQMPPGVPVATVAINAGANAAVLAAQILAVADPVVADRLQQRKQAMRAGVLAKDEALQRSLDNRTDNN
ncbi:MAG: 5-(carboxyamino)imidazole ribonucleotide mutase [Propionibacteriaceae bacterium]|nr:5-(carboxyamino)imidazole ribonucleotide mutase [Propionibacteriaceae bacterium]